MQMGIARLRICLYVPSTLIFATIVFINYGAKVLLLQGNYIFILKRITNHEISNKQADTCLLDIGKYHIGLVLLNQREVTNLQMYVSENTTISKRDFEEVVSTNKSTYNRNIVAIHNPNFTLIPTELVDTNNLQEYVKPLFDVEHNELLIHNKLNNGCTSIASIKKATKEMIESRFSNATIVNTSASLLNSYTFNLSSDKTYHGFVALHYEGFTLTVYKNFTCQLHTMYLSNDLNDVLYFIANACTQMGILADEITIQIHGDIVEHINTTITKLNQFYKHVLLLNNASFITNESELNELTSGLFYTQLSLIQCVS
jgi:hypothetical protein